MSRSAGPWADEAWPRPPSGRRRSASPRIAWSVRTLRASLRVAVPRRAGPRVITLISLYYDDVFNVGPGRGVLVAWNRRSPSSGSSSGRPGQPHADGATRPGHHLRRRTWRSSPASAMAGLASPGPHPAHRRGPVVVHRLRPGHHPPPPSALLSLVIPPRARSFGPVPRPIAIVSGYLIFAAAGALGDHLGLRGGIAVLVPVLVVDAAILASGRRHHRRRHPGRDGVALAAQISREAKAEVRPSCSSSTTSTSATARCRSCSTSTSRSSRARSWPCSAPTARASRPCCAPSVADAARQRCRVL